MPCFLHTHSAKLADTLLSPFGCLQLCSTCRVSLNHLYVIAGHPRLALGPQQLHPDTLFDHPLRLEAHTTTKAFTSWTYIRRPRSDPDTVEVSGHAQDERHPDSVSRRLLVCGSGSQSLAASSIHLKCCSCNAQSAVFILRCVKLASCR